MLPFVFLFYSSHHGGCETGDNYSSIQNLPDTQPLSSCWSTSIYSSSSEYPGAAGSHCKIWGKGKKWRWWRASLFGFAFSWGYLTVCKASEIDSSIWGLYLRIHWCFHSWGGRSVTGLFLSRVLQNLTVCWVNLDEHARHWAKYQWKTASGAVFNQRAHVLLLHIDLHDSQGCLFLNLSASCVARS